MSLIFKTFGSTWVQYSYRVPAVVFNTTQALPSLHS